jgi:hypothetical protein
MKTYTILFAQDIPHYGSVEIEAKNDADALRRAKKYWRDVKIGAEPWPLNDAQYDSAVSARIVLINDESDESREIAHDVRLDEYMLMQARTAREERTLDNAKAIFSTLESVMHWWQSTAHTDDDEMPARLFDKAQRLIVKVKGGAA